ncbi:DUF202 domain-containing protein [Luteococcus sp. H138]|uniref:DUF202 domain-containing protein n=1 Tax=unclassified Luteococcus TaxID=2639923 RepID=UPI00313EB25E
MPWDRGLQPERTALAWDRCALSLLACSLVILGVDKRPVDPTQAGPTAGVVLYGLWLIARGRRRYQDTSLALIDQRQTRLPDGSRIFVTSVAAAILGLVAIAT